MSERRYRQLVAEFRNKDRMFPDNGRSERPWEHPLREAIKAEIASGLPAQWAQDAAAYWQVERRA